MSGFASLKKSSQSSIDRLSKEIEKLSSKGYDDERVWSLTRDKAQNGYALIRFLPAVEGEDVPWVRVFSHGFQGKGGWMIENCPTTIGKKCPICEANNELWSSGIEANKQIARDRKRKLSYIANILVISDPANPANDGKVFLYKFGKKIFDKLQEAMNPTTPDEPKFNPFDLWKGANFKLKSHLESGYVSYEKSGFQPQSELFDGDDKRLEVLWKSQYPLLPFVAADQFKAYEELSSRLSIVLKGGVAEGAATRAEEAKPESDFRSKMRAADDAPFDPTPKKNAPAKAAKPDEDDDDATMAYFKRLAEDED
jgi:hypothetical protein